MNNSEYFALGFIFGAVITSFIGYCLWKIKFNGEIPKHEIPKPEGG